MNKIILIKHTKGAPGLRLFGLGPNLMPCGGLDQLKNLFNKNTSWAKKRNIKDIKTCLAYSDAIVSIWVGKKIVGFGRALSDGIYRAVLWDIVIDANHQGKGFGKRIVNTLLGSKNLKNTKKVYLMTSNKKDFYYQLAFSEVTSQKLLLKQISNF
tara:strand:+ start:1244 stop:1708 length:465 start_codon:yes stop_codon:yes gene_type:complete